MMGARYVEGPSYPWITTCCKRLVYSWQREGEADRDWCPACGAAWSDRQARQVEYRRAEREANEALRLSRLDDHLSIDDIHGPDPLIASGLRVA